MRSIEKYSKEKEREREKRHFKLSQKLSSRASLDNEVDVEKRDVEPYQEIIELI